ncbi:transcriptional regulator with XRE-family HTH domain [Sporomusaceae bacterium BoRhaA]|uniref:helix-turn-helix domain-containing protein n=1 Tax=Pelorhabdus rhamnosifermentans TaxID=2772457 RepID=UPI001C05F723|nr:helix-turn-helix transcriptional regulator [Pelorhabdus rhamnosifermentans]MBU2701656.1 transcriptional regulator with XRE-family HTH domain [Pelorhabdus rhamnosifermentans]
MSVGKRISFLRKNAKKTQKIIELETGIPQTTLSGWETDKTVPNLYDAHKIATALGVTVNDLLDDAEIELSKTG